MKITAGQREKWRREARKEVDDGLKKSAIKNENIASIVLLCFFFILAGVLLYIGKACVIPAGGAILVYPVLTALKKRGYISNGC